jgi:para-aminobenzoate synthetase / 4-amino-4-deoxychorismate lyase
MSGGPAEGAGVRLDALVGSDGEGRSFRFTGARGVLTATRIAEVVPLLRRVDAAAAAGMHAVGFVAYEAAAAFDPALRTRPPDPRLPLARFHLFRSRADASPPAVEGDATLPGPWTPDLDERAYADRVAVVREHLAAGDSYQVNLTLRLRAPFGGDPAALYARICAGQRSSFCALLPLEDGGAIVSASPELFFRRRDREIVLRPMKGTRPRGRWAAEDLALARDLAGSPKDRAENLMIVDLLRNDVGRVAETGSVVVEDPFRVERFETVHQMTSTIRARLRPGVGTPEVFAALFPCGSVTGAPKVRTTGIIEALETGPRGVYCGAIGFVSPGESAFSVAIRTLLVRDDTAELGVGSGVTWDSAAADEYRECLAKAAFVRRAPPAFRLLETIAWRADGGWTRLDEHLLRMEGSAGYFGFAFRREDAEDALRRAVAAGGTGPLAVRLTLAYDGAAEALARALPPRRGPVRVAVACGDPVDSADPMLYHKTTERSGYERRLAAYPGADDVLLVNERGELTESTIANLVLRIDGELWTPPLGAGLLPGVLRAELLHAGRVWERTLRPADLAGAGEVWLVGSVRGWRRAEPMASSRSGP